MPSPATEEDFKEGRAVFYVPDGRSSVYDLGVQLPADARLLRDLDEGADVAGLKAGTVVTVVQAEIVDGRDILIGFRVGESEGVCMGNEVELIR